MSRLFLSDSVLQNFNPCPFCGSKEDLRIDLARAGNIAQAEADNARITCTRCQVVMEAYAEAEHFIPLEGDLYKRIPKKYADEVLQERWNKRR